jgi:hypothetical protein
MFCEIELENFFSFGGVSVEDDIVQFPESKLINAIYKYPPYSMEEI